MYLILKVILVQTLIELGISKDDLFVNDTTKNCYHPGRSGAINLISEKGPCLALFGEIHPAIIKRLDIKMPNVFGLEIKKISASQIRRQDKQKKFSNFRFSKI